MCALALPFRPFYSIVSRLDASHIPRVIFVILSQTLLHVFAHSLVSEGILYLGPKSSYHTSGLDALVFHKLILSYIALRILGVCWL